MIQYLINLIKIELTVMLTAALPIIELKGAIPVGISLGLSPFHAFIISFIGSMIPVPLIFFTARPIFKYLRKTKHLSRFVNAITRKSMRKSKNIKKYGTLGLFIFVAIPLPGTGVWTGSFIASFLNIRFKWSFPAILLGNFLAGIIIMTISSGVINIIT